LYDTAGELITSEGWLALAELPLNSGFDLESVLSEKQAGTGVAPQIVVARLQQSAAQIGEFDNR
jgi:hypothetical protein